MQHYVFSVENPANIYNIYLFKVNNRSTKKMFDLFSMLNFEHISHLFLVILLLTLNK